MTEDKKEQAAEPETSTVGEQDAEGAGDPVGALPGDEAELRSGGHLFGVAAGAIWLCSAATIGL